MSTAGIETTNQNQTFKLDDEGFALDISTKRDVLDITVEKPGCTEPWTNG